MTEAICSLRVSTTRKRSRTPWNSSSIHVMPRPGKVNAWVASHSSSVRTSPFLVVVIRFPGSGRDAIDTSLCIVFNECIFHHECKRLHIDYATTDKVFIGGIPNTRHSRLSAARSAAVSCRVGPSQARSGSVVDGDGGDGPARTGQGGAGGVLVRATGAGIGRVASRPGDAMHGLVSRHRSSVGLRWPSKRIAALHRLPIRSVWASDAPCAALRWLRAAYDI